MILSILKVHTGLEQPTDRDSFTYKRVELSGTLIYELFNCSLRFNDHVITSHSGTNGSYNTKKSVNTLRLVESKGCSVTVKPKGETEVVPYVHRSIYGLCD